MSAFACVRCRALGRDPLVRNPYDKYQERVEYVRIDGQHRLWVYAVRDVCRSCVEEMKAEAKAEAKGANRHEQGMLEW